MTVYLVKTINKLQQSYYSTQHINEYKYKKHFKFTFYLYHNVYDFKYGSNLWVQLYGPGIYFGNVEACAYRLVPIILQMCCWQIIIQQIQTHFKLHYQETARRWTCKIMQVV